MDKLEVRSCSSEQSKKDKEKEMEEERKLPINGTVREGEFYYSVWQHIVQ